MSVRKKTDDTIVLIEAKTQNRSIEFVYYWEIKWSGFSCIYESETFSPDRSKRIAFYMKFAGSTGRVTLCLFPCDIPDISLTLRLCLRDNGGVPNIVRKTLGPEDFTIQSFASIKEFEITGSFKDSGCNCDSNNSFGIQSPHPDKCLEIDCTFQLNFCESVLWDIPLIEVPKCVIPDPLNKLFEKREYSDVIFDVCGQEIPAHKAILSLHSPVFAMMFEHEMQEKLQNRVNVTDIEANIFTEMLRYIYTGTVEDIGLIAGELLPAAEKYNLARLKIMCERSLQINLTQETAASTLILADRYNAELLKVRTAQFINLHIGQVINTKGFQAMTKSNPILMAEVLRVSAEKLLP